MIFESEHVPEDNPTKTDNLVLWARGKLSQWDSHAGEWTEEAIRSFGMVAADQWSDDDRAAMDEDDRPMFTFNRMAGFVRGICGLEVSNRQEVRFLGRSLEDAPVNEIYNAAAKWVRESCDAEDEESDAFKDMVTCGLGWTETHFSTVQDPDGVVLIERIDPLHMRWDVGARKRGLTDTKWRARLKTLPISEVEETWGKKIADEVRMRVEDSVEAIDELFSTPHDATRAFEYEKTASGARAKKGVPVVQFQYFTLKNYYRVMMPEGQTDLPEDRYKKLKELIPDLPAQKFKKREFRQLIYSGSTKFEDVTLPTDDFTFQAITGIRDRNKGTWYGFVRDLADPQKWVNKFFSSMADVVASQAKGGLLAETDAFVSKDQAQEDWANPRSIVWLKRGGLDKIKERASAGIPSGVAQLLEFTVGSLPHVAGVNLEFLGLAAREQPGVLEAQRKQSAIATLAEFFNAMRLYRKQQGRILLQFITTYLSDGRLIRIVGAEGEQFVPLVRQPGSIKYDAVVDEAPTSPDTKARTWAALTQILPVVMKMGLPVPPEVLDYAPFPAGLQQAWKKLMNPQQQLPPQVQQQMQQMQEQMQQLAQENQQLKSKQAETMMALQIEQQRDQQRMQLETAKAQHQSQLRVQEADRQLALAESRAEREMALKEAIAARELALKEAIAAQEARMKQVELGIDVVREDQDRAEASQQQDAALQEMAAKHEEIIGMIQELARLGEENQQTLLALKDEVDSLDGLEKDVAVQYSPDGEITGAKVVQRRKRRGK